MIPSINRKVNSGQINSLGMVTSHKMMETEMGNRGSKSGSFGLPEPVKEQRVDGSYLRSRIDSKLRCTLTDCESNYQISVLSNQFFLPKYPLIRLPLIIAGDSFGVKQGKKRIKFSATRNLTNLNTTTNLMSSRFPSLLGVVSGAKGVNEEPSLKLNPWFVTGLTDAEGCFGLYLYKKSTSKLGWYVILDYKITLHEKDVNLLNQLQIYFSAGSVFNHGKQTKQFGVRSIKDLQILINHFDQYTLKTQKLNDYNLFKEAFKIVLNKEHLTIEGLNKLIAIKALMNRGLTSQLASAFCPLDRLIKQPTLIAARRGTDSGTNKLDPNWLSGFTSGDGSFQVSIRENSKGKRKPQVILRFSIGQHIRDELLLRSFIEFLGCGNVSNKHSISLQSRSEYITEFRVEKFLDIYVKVIPFFERYPIIGQKSLDFQDFCKVANLMKEKAHLTDEGINEIRKIKAGMNRARDWKI